MKLFFYSLIENWHLILRLTKRDIEGKYKGSILGILWSFLNPLMMLAVYTFVFGLVFQARWGIETDQNFSIVLFVGLIFHGLLGESLSRAPTLITLNATYVKKVIFPLDTLIWVSVLGILFHFLVSLLILLLAEVTISQNVPWTWVYLPIVLMPILIVCLGVSWLLASLGVYIKDISQFVGIIVTMLLFLSPIFYPLEAIPQEYQIYILMNPLSLIVEQARQILVFGEPPKIGALIKYCIISLIFTQLCYVWFRKTKRGFGDVL